MFTKFFMLFDFLLLLLKSKSKKVKRLHELLSVVTRIAWRFRKSLVFSINIHQNMYKKISLLFPALYLLLHMWTRRNMRYTVIFSTHKRKACVCVYISVCLFCCLSVSVCQSICLSISLSIYLFIYLSIYLSIYLFIYLSICLSVYPFICFLCVRRRGKESAYLYVCI